MQVETALFFETVEEIYARVFRTIKPRTDVPAITVRFCKYANANSKIRLNDGELTVQISDLLQPAPAPVQEALACILLGKLFRKPPDTGVLALYQRYMGRTEVRRSLQLAKQQRGRKTLAPPAGKHYDLVEIFTELNRKYFRDSLSRPMLGWSRRPARTILGHYDPSHHAIVLTKLLDSDRVPRLLVDYVMFHEMLHIEFPTEHGAARRRIHTKAFKEAEKNFQNYAEARRELKAFAVSSPELMLCE